VDAASLAVFIAIFGHAEWHSNLLRFTARVWHVFVTYNAGSTSPGFVSSILFSLLGVVVLAIYIAHTKGRKALKDHMIESFALAVFGIVTVVFIVYGTQFAWQVAKVGYEDHKTLAAKVDSLEGEKSHMVDPMGRDSTIADLKDKLRESQSQLASRKKMMFIGDPVFDNTRKILTAFQSYRIMSKGQRCVVYITAPSQSSIATIFAEFSNSVSGCSTFGPSVRVNPDLDEETTSGMISGVVLIHALRGDAAANRVEEALSGTIPLERSYKPLSNAFPHYQDQGTGELVLWLQFGPDVRWTSDRSTTGK